MLVTPEQYAAFTTVLHSTLRMLFGSPKWVDPNFVIYLEITIEKKIQILILAKVIFGKKDFDCEFGRKVLILVKLLI